jgi:hypothetical protein
MKMCHARWQSAPNKHGRYIYGPGIYHSDATIVPEETWLGPGQRGEWVVTGMDSREVFLLVDTASTDKQTQGYQDHVELF